MTLPNMRGDQQPRGSAGPMPDPNGRLVATKPILQTVTVNMTREEIASPEFIRHMERALWGDGDEPAITAVVRRPTRYERAALWLRRVAACIRTR